MKKAEEEKLSVEQSARILRYECFFDALKNGKCTKVATAHHLDDNTESVLFNLFRGTGVKGATGIEKNFEDKIIRPFLSVSKQEIEEYAKENAIPFVTDKTNFCCDYTRNALRLKVIPEIKKLFPKMQESIERFSDILKEENDFLDQESKKVLTILDGKAKITIPCHRAIFSRATVMALKSLGIIKDYEKIHVDDAYSLCEKQNGCSINLKNGVIAVKEYDGIVFYKSKDIDKTEHPFSLGEHKLGNFSVCIKDFPCPKNLKGGLYGDLDKIPKTAVIRTRKDGDCFTKFGGGTKSLGDYLTDKKIPIRERENLPLIADGNQVLVIFGVAVSDKIKIDNQTTKFLHFYLGDD